MTARAATARSEIEVLRAGPLATVQDLGRTGLRHLGVAQCGALDTLALEVGNRLVGNRRDCAAVEITLGPAAFRFPRATRIALTGTGFGATLDGQPVHAWWSVPVAAGQTLTLAAARDGMRGYLCVAGCIDVPPLLGSRSTDLGARFGGMAGRALRDGDRLPFGVQRGGPRRSGEAHNDEARNGESRGGPGSVSGASGIGAALPADTPAFGVKPPEWCAFARATEPAARAGQRAHRALAVRVLPGPHFGEFSGASQLALWHDEWLVTPHSNRMGYRLAGAPLVRERAAELLSHAVLPGTIQVPPNGQPIVLMHDAQTTGGYPQIGSVIRADLWKLAQARLNGALRFVPVTLDVAQAALRAEAAYLRQIETAIALREEIQGQLRRTLSRAA